MISVAAELAGMHPQTLRVYEARGLIKPSRSPKQTRLYSRPDVERLQRIQELTIEFGLNLAGVERVLTLEQTMEAMRAQLEAHAQAGRGDGARDARADRRGSPLVQARAGALAAAGRDPARHDAKGFEVPIHRIPIEDREKH